MQVYPCLFLEFENNITHIENDISNPSQLEKDKQTNKRTA